jgi:hypothetical protein
MRKYIVVPAFNLSQKADHNDWIHDPDANSKVPANDVIPVTEIVERIVRH